MFEDDLIAAAAKLIAGCKAHGKMIATAESCTGGLLAGLVTQIPGSSFVFERGFVTYSNAAKSELLGVDERLIADHGAVSAEVARAMALGALARSKAQLSLAVTGIAGPGGGSDFKPVGLVYLACATGGGVEVREERYGDLGREQVRAAALRTALALLARGAAVA